MLPGMVLVLLGGYCLDYHHIIFRAICNSRLLSSNYSFSTGPNVLYIDGFLYLIFRILEVIKLRLKQNPISWISEIALLIIGDWIVFYAVVFVGFLWFFNIHNGTL